MLFRSTTNIVLNTIVADVLCKIADELAPLKYIEDIRNHSLAICKRILRKHNRILFSKDGYSEEWIAEAQERGLPNISTYVHSIDALVDEKAVAMFERNNVYNFNELTARTNILYDEVIKDIKIEAMVLLDLSKKVLLPALIKEIKFYSDGLNSLGKANAFYERKINRLTSLLDQFDVQYHKLKDAFFNRKTYDDIKEKAFYMNDQVVKQMQELRIVIDAIEESISAENYPVPTYEQLFTSVN